MSTTEVISHAKGAHKVRPAAFSDADAVFRLLSGLKNNVLPARADFDEAFKEALDASEVGHVLLVAEDARGAVQGYAFVTLTRLLYTNGYSAQIQELVVDPDAAGNGFGTMLVAAAEQECHDRGIGQLTVASLRAAMFYERLGYRSTSDFLKRTFD